MTYTQSQFGPEFTPTPIKKLILITTIVSLFCALTDVIFLRIFDMVGPQDWLSLSWWGINHYMLWQPLTYLFVLHTGYGGITLFYLIRLTFYMYLLWIMGTTVFEYVGRKPFLQLYFFCGIATGLITLLLMPLTGQYTTLSGPAPAVLAMFTVWAMLFPTTEILIFFLIPVQAKWLFAGVAGAIALINISQLNFLNLSFYLTSIVLGYLYAVSMWDIRSPFPFTHKFDEIIANAGNFVKEQLERGINLAKGIKKKGTIVDFKTGKELEDDDTFIDSMLNKISLKGEQSLSWKERERMKEISEKRSQTPKKR